MKMPSRVGDVAKALATRGAQLPATPARGLREPRRRGEGNTVTLRTVDAAIVLLGLASEDTEIMRCRARYYGVSHLTDEDVIASATGLEPAGRYVTLEDALCCAIEHRDARRRRVQREAQQKATQALQAGRTEEQWETGREWIAKIKGALR